MAGDLSDRVAGYIDKSTRRIKKKLDDHLDDEEFEVLVVRDKNWIQHIFRELTKASVAKQVAIGGTGGWCSGYLFGKVGKAAALTLGGSLLIMQVAHHQGYITVNWGKLEKNMNSYRRQIERSAQRRLPAILEEVRDFAVENAFLAGGFAGGFLLGVAS